MLALKQQLVELTTYFHQRGWTPATSSNFSARVDQERILVTVSGKDKGTLTDDDFMLVNYQGQPVDSDPNKKPSAETLLHTQLYNWHQDIQVVLHTHSVNATVLSMKLDQQDHLRLDGYEVLKAFPSITSHEVSVDLPIFDNTQDISALSELVDNACHQGIDIPGYLIRGHGLYAWGNSFAEAKKHIEALEFFLECELIKCRLN